MASKATIGPKIVVDGEKEFKQSLSEINASLRENASEMGLLTSEYSDNAKSVDALTDKQKLLTKDVDTQKQKVETLERAVSNATNQYGAADKRTVEWRTSLNKAKETLIEKEKALKLNNDAMDKATGKTKGLFDAENTLSSQSSALSGIVGNITGQLGIDLPASASVAIGSVGLVAGALIAVTKAASDTTKAIVDLTVKVGHSSDDILTLASTTGMTTDQVQEFKYMADGLIDTPFENITGAVTRMIRAMYDNNEAFNKLGVAYRMGADGSLADANKIFLEVIDKLGHMTNETDRDAIAMQLFGKSARELNPLIEAGSAKIKEFAQQAHNTGYVMDTEMLNRFGELDDSMVNIAKNTKTLRDAFADAFLPVVKEGAEKTGDLVQSLHDLAKDTGFQKSMSELAESFTPLIDALVGQEDLLKNIKPLAKSYADSLTITAKAITDIINKFNEFKKFRSEGFQWNGKLIDSAANWLNNLFGIPGYARGTSFHPGGRALVGEDGPEIVDLPAGSKVYPNGSSGGVTQHISVTLQASNFRQMADVVDLFDNFQRNANAGRVTA